MKEKIKVIKLSHNREIIIEVNKIARQSDGSAIIKMGNTMLLSTVVFDKNFKEKLDFLPLLVEYQEKFASSGKIPGGFLRREGKLLDHEVLISRLVDRVIRPCFPKNFFYEISVNIYLISSDNEIMPDSLAALSASSAITASGLPFYGPVSEVRVGRINNEFLINPTFSEMKHSDIDIIVGGTDKSVSMVEGEMSELSEIEIINAIKFAHKEIQNQCKIQKELSLNSNFLNFNFLKNKNNSKEEKDFDLKNIFFNDLYEIIYQAAKKNIFKKHDRKKELENIKKVYIKGLLKNHQINSIVFNKYFNDILKNTYRSLTLFENIRIDGRKLNEIRPISIESNFLPSAHGSVLFTRGETQSLTSVTLGSKFNEQIIDRATISGSNKILLHYNFPGFSTGEIKLNRGGPSRREIGHGNLALRALKNIIPDYNDSYTIRIVSDILESNGSSSMATVCAASLALMDAGIKIKSHVSGIAMGLISDQETNKYAILSDILGDEDSLGDMDFKITGTKNGITACQMDIKILGISYSILEKSLTQANQGLVFILKKMNICLNKPLELKSHIPRFKNIQVYKDEIGVIIGPSGKTIQEIQKNTGVNINIEESEGIGLIKIFAPNKEGMLKAEKKILSIIEKPKIDKIYNGIVKSILSFGAFVEFMPGKDGLLHISEVQWPKVDDLSEILKIGDKFKVKLISIDSKTGKYKLSKKILIPKD
jgi:polyribonucleotide nucleotidyltransferase